MRNKLFNVIVFAAGAAIGSVVTWRIVKTKYEQITQEAVDSVKEACSEGRLYTEIGKSVEDEAQDELDEDAAADYSELVDNLGYTKSKNEEGDEEMPNRPYIISPEEFREIDNYEAITLTHYSDGVLVDEEGEPIEEKEIDYLVGLDYAEHFGEYEDDSVFVRNDETKSDYEILRDLRNYSDICNE